MDQSDNSNDAEHPSAVPSLEERTRDPTATGRGGIASGRRARITTPESATPRSRRTTPTGPDDHQSPQTSFAAPPSWQTIFAAFLELQQDFRNIRQALQDRQEAGTIVSRLPPPQFYQTDTQPHSQPQQQQLQPQQQQEQQQQQRQPLPSMASEVRQSTTAALSGAKYRKMYRFLTDRFMEKMRVEKNVGQNRSWDEIEAHPGDEALLQKVYFELLGEDPTLRERAEATDGGVSEALWKCKEAYYRKVPHFTQAVPTIPSDSRTDNQSTSNQSGVGGSTLPHRRSSQPSVASRRRDSNRKKRKLKRRTAALDTPEIQEKHPDATEEVLAAQLSSEYSTTEYDKADVSSTENEDSAPDRGHNRTGRGNEEEMGEEGMSPTEHGSPSRAKYRRRSRIAWRSVEDQEMIDDIDAASRSRRKQRKDRSKLLEAHDVILRPFSVRKRPKPLERCIQRRWVSKVFKDAYNGAVVNVSNNTPPSDPEAWGTTPTYVMVEDEGVDADHEGDGNAS